MAQQAYEKAENFVLQGTYDIVVLNGLHQLLEQNIISLDRLLSLCERKPENVELILSGSRIPESLLDKADLITEMVVRHHPAKIRMEKTFAQTGSIEVVTGKGKGKTTYCLGKAMLMSCMGVPSFILQVIKSPRAYGEVMAIERLPNLTIKTMGKGFLKGLNEPFEKKHIQAAKKAWEVWLHEIYSFKYGLLVLDEINVATYYGLIRSERVQEMLFLKPPNLHLLLSGRNAHPDVLKMATTVIEMQEVRHPFQKGIKARKGIEY